MFREISSTQNPLVKRLISLSQKSRTRRKEQAFVIEGIREVERALQKGVEFEELLFSHEWSETGMDAFGADSDAGVNRVSKEVFSKIAYRGTVKNVLGIARMWQKTLNDLTLPANPFLLILEKVEKPGNLGAVLRSADAAGVDGIIVCDQETDLFNPNVIRNSLGGFFDLPVVQAGNEEAIAFLREKGLSIFTTWLEASVPYTDIDLTKGCAIVLGSESHGVTETWIRASDQNIIIPMKGIVDSLNVSNAASILMFEAARQRM